LLTDTRLIFAAYLVISLIGEHLRDNMHVSHCWGQNDLGSKCSLIKCCRLRDYRSQRYNDGESSKPFRFDDSIAARRVYHATRLRANPCAALLVRCIKIYHIPASDGPLRQTKGSIASSPAHIKSINNIEWVASSRRSRPDFATAQM